MLSSWLLLMASYGLVKSGPAVEAEGLWLETGPIYCWLLLGGFISGAYAIFVKSKDISHGLCNKVIEHLIFVCVCVCVFLQSLPSHLRVGVSTHDIKPHKLPSRPSFDFLPRFAESHCISRISWLLVIGWEACPACWFATTIEHVLMSKWPQGMSSLIMLLKCVQATWQREGQIVSKSRCVRLDDSSLDSLL